MRRPPSPKAKRGNREQQENAPGNVRGTSARRLDLPEPPPRLWHRLPRTRTKRETLLDVARRIPVDALRPYLNYGLLVAADAMSISGTTLKRLCRHYGIKRWPFRQISGIDRAIERLESRLTSGKRDLPGVAARLRQLRDHRESIVELTLQGAGSLDIKGSFPAPARPPSAQPAQSGSAARSPPSQATCQTAWVGEVTQQPSQDVVRVKHQPSEVPNSPSVSPTPVDPAYVCGEANVDDSCGPAECTTLSRTPAKCFALPRMPALDVPLGIPDSLAEAQHQNSLTSYTWPMETSPGTTDDGLNSSEGSSSCSRPRSPADVEGSRRSAMMPPSSPAGKIGKTARLVDGQPVVTSVPSFTISSPPRREWACPSAPLQQVVPKDGSNDGGDEGMTVEDFDVLRDLLFGGEEGGSHGASDYSSHAMGGGEAQMRSTDMNRSCVMTIGDYANTAVEGQREPKIEIDASSLSWTGN